MGLTLLLVLLGRLSVLGAAGPPVVLAIDPPPGIVSQLRRITVTFNEPVTEVAHNDLALNALGANHVPTVSNNVVRFDFPLPPYGTVAAALRNIRDLQGNNMAATNFTYFHVDAEAPHIERLFPLPGSTVRTLSQVEVFFSEPVRGVDASDLRLNGVPAVNVLVQPGGVVVFQFASPAPGPVELAWAPDHGVTDCASIPNAFGEPGPTPFVLDPAHAYGSVQLTELCAANRTGLVDEDGLPSDWLELHNLGMEPVDLAGWSLSDDLAVPGKWVFPSVTIGAGDRLVVFASAKDRAPAVGTNRLHVNFTLDAGGEPLGLFTPESPRRMHSGFPGGFPVQANDVSWGLDAWGRWRYFVGPTPGAPNPPSEITGMCEPVHFGVGRGFFDRPFELVLSCPTPGATIRYTTNGVEPTAHTGEVYNAPLSIGTTTLLRAAAFHDQRAPSKAGTRSYFFDLDNAMRSLPVLSIVTAPETFEGPTGITGMSVSNFVSQVWTPLGPDDYNNHLQHGRSWERPVSAEWIRPEDNGGFQIDCGIRVQGSGFMRWRYGGPNAAGGKVSYRLYFRGDYGESRLRYPLFPTSPLSEFDVIVLRAGHNDQKNPFIKDELARRLHADMGHGAGAGTFVNLFINGVYQGYYNPCERVDDDSFEAWEGPGEGWDHLSPGSELRQGDRTAWDELMDLFIQGRDLRQPEDYQAVNDRLDLVSFVDYLLLCHVSGIGDWPHNNWHVARPRAPGGRFRYYGWDFESAFGNNPEVNMFSNDMNGPSEIALFYRGLSSSPEFKQLWADRVQRHFFDDGALSEVNIRDHFNRMQAELAGVIPDMNLSILNQWLPRRPAALFSQFSARGLLGTNTPVFSHRGGSVPPGFTLSMAAPQGGTIYYTLDGQDPRVAFTGLVAPGAFAYGGPVPIEADVVVTARTLRNGSWSPLVTAAFQVARLGVPVRFTEIHYNPLGDNSGEFIELVNLGVTPLDLGGFHFDGVRFVFPLGTLIEPGSRIVLVNNDTPALFGALHPGVSVLGYYGGDLANSGERIALLDAEGDVVTAVHYSDDNGWPTAADGEGPSLELRSDDLDPGVPTSWQASGVLHGTPGAPPSPAPGLLAVKFNEIMADNEGSVTHEGTTPDWIELFNPLPVSQDLSECSLSNGGSPAGLVFPAGTSIAPQDRLVVWCDDTATSGLHAGFSLSREGGDLFLRDSRGNLVDAVSFGPQWTDHSIARGSGGWFLALPTPGTDNAAAEVADPNRLIINEWLANSAPGSTDWIELHNLSSSAPLALEGVHVGTGMEVVRLGTPAFIPPGGYLVLYADEGSGFGHLPFRLSAEGGTIELHDPAASQIDRVSYGAQAEGESAGRWPDGGTGFALFPGTASPGAPNHLATWSGPIWNEVRAGNDPDSPGFVELLNPGSSPFSLEGLSVVIGSGGDDGWFFPVGAALEPQAIVVLWCDDSRPASAEVGDFNLGRALSLDGDSVALFDLAGRRVSHVQFGPQVPGLSVGVQGGDWRLLAAPTPGAPNTPPHLLGPPTLLQFNEWMASSTGGPDWFELFNPGNVPVDLSGLYLTDDPSIVGLTRFRVPDLSYVGGGQWSRFVADNDPAAGPNHVTFNLAAGGESLLLVRASGSEVGVLRSVVFGAQEPDVSQGLLPDGSPEIVSFPGSASPGTANYLAGPPQVLVGPADLRADAGQSVAFNALVTGSPPLHYAWYRNHEPIPNATSATLELASVQVSDEGAYSLVITNLAGSARAEASLIVQLLPRFVAKPSAQTVAPGEVVTLSAQVTANPRPFTYEWRLNGSIVASNVTSRDSDFVRFAAPPLPGQYRLAVTVGNSGQPVGRVSTEVLLTVAPDSDLDGLPDFWEAAHGFPTDTPASPGQDTDGDGLPDAEEYLAGTSPIDTASVLRVDAIAAAPTPTLSFIARSNHTYSVLWQEAPVPGEWNRLEDVVSGETNRALEVADPDPGSGPRFYRLVTPRQPEP